MSKLRIKDAPLLPDVNGTEKIPTGGRGDYTISVDQIKNHIFQDVGKELVGLGNVDNTSDLDKPVSTAQQAALNLKADKTYVDTNLDLKADKTNVYTRSETSLALSKKADLVNGVVPENQIPSSFNDVLEFTTSTLPMIGESGKIYVTTDNNKTWRWGGNKYVEISGWNPDSVSKRVTLPTYFTKESGVDPVTGVTDGAYFNVRSENDDIVAIEYQNVGGVPTPSGKSYPSSSFVQDVRVKAPYFFNTVAAMVSANNLSDGMIAGTKGYHNISDDGGAIYLISSTATEYSIPLSNGLHAVFRDTFDIRKFGIISSATADQTECIRRMINYADSREYEIDFLNYDIMTPNLVTFTTSRGSVMRGMGFYYVHRIKNLKIHNDKTVPIYQGCTPLQFFPKRKGDGNETFELVNVTLDLYVAEQTFISSEGDGRFHGFIADWHPDYPVGTPTNKRSESGYKFKTDGVYVTSPGVTSTMALRFWFNEIHFKNMYGDYIGYYTTHFATKFKAENCHGTYRDDLHAAGRLLVTNFFQEEQEVGTGGFEYTQDSIEMFNCSCLKYSTQEPHVFSRRQIMGRPTVKKAVYENIIGSIAWNSTAYEQGTYNSIKMKNCNSILSIIFIRFLDLVIEDSTLSGRLFEKTHNKTAPVSLKKCTITDAIFIAGTEFDNFTLEDCSVNATLNASSSVIKNLKFKGGSLNVARVYSGDFEKIEIDGVKSNAPIFDSMFYKQGETYTTSTIEVFRSDFKNSSGLFVRVRDDSIATQAVNLKVLHSSFVRYPSLTLGNNGSASFQYTSGVGSGSKSYNPPSIEAGQFNETTVTLNGAKVGMPVQVAFSQYNSNIDIVAQVSADDTVTVKFKNIGTTAVDLVSGTLTVKLI